jgi:predicted O-methyltransferase YrrM
VISIRLKGEHISLCVADDEDVIPPEMEETAMEPILDGGSGPMAEAELAQVLWAIHDGRDSAVLEIGTGRGVSTLRLNEAARDRVVTVDLNHATIRHFCDGGIPMLDKTVFIEADSSHRETIDRVANYAPFDVILLDGDHTYEGVSQDYLNYTPMLSAHGVCFMHDIGWGDVRTFWREGRPLRLPSPGRLTPPVTYRLMQNLGLVVFP